MVIVFSFSAAIVQRTTQKSDGSCNVTSDIKPSFSKYAKNSPINSANTYKKAIANTKYCSAHHDAEMCFLANCIYHSLLLGNVEEFQQILDHMCFIYQHVDCLILSSSINSVEILSPGAAKYLILCKEQSAVIKGEEWTEYPASRKKDTWGKITGSILWASSNRWNQ